MPMYFLPDHPTNLYQEILLLATFQNNLAFALNPFYHFKYENVLFLNFLSVLLFTRHLRKLLNHNDKELFYLIWFWFSDCSFACFCLTNPKY